MQMLCSLVSIGKKNKTQKTGKYHETKKHYYFHHFVVFYQ
jgi:hypothetical protein